MQDPSNVFSLQQYPTGSFNQMALESRIEGGSRSTWNTYSTESWSLNANYAVGSARAVDRYLNDWTTVSPKREWAFLDEARAALMTQLIAEKRREQDDDCCSVGATVHARQPEKRASN